MRFDASIYEDDFLDSEDTAFTKINRKAKTTKQKKNTPIREQRKAKTKEREKLLYDLSEE